MKPARIAVLVVAAGAAGLAALMLSGGDPAPVAVTEQGVALPATSVDVLVAAGNVERGRALTAADLRWQPWPIAYRPANAITRDDQPQGLESTAGSIVVAGMLAGDPIRREKLIKADSNGFMSAILPSGMRAVAVSTDTRGTNTAGGFILPNDRVDVIRTFRDEETSKPGSDVQKSETLLSNIRVLAIGQTVQDNAGEKVATGETATLEVTAAQAETLILAQKSGPLSLALRSLSDAAQTSAPAIDRSEPGMTVVRFGVATRLGGTP